MTIQQLKYIIALDTHRHFIKAAESCFVAQSTLTQQVKKLEEEIALVLFDRSRYPLKVTPMGKQFINKARVILKEIEELKALVNSEKDQMEGTFTLGIIPTLCPYLLARFIDDFMKSNPTTKLVIEELQTERIIELLKYGQLDLGILATPVENDDIIETPLFYEPFLVYANIENELLKQKFIHPKNLRSEGLWILKQGHCFRNHTLNICALDTTENQQAFELEAGSIETLKNIINTVSGYTLIPELSYNKHIDSNNVIRFDSPQPVREISIVSHKHFSKVKLIDELRKSILNNIPDSFTKNTNFKRINWR